MDTERSAIARKLLPSRFHDSYFMHEYGRIEALRATRYNTCFSIVLAEAREGTDGPAGAAQLGKLAAMILDCVRNCDIAGLAGPGQVLIILPETDYFGALMTIRKLSRHAGGAALLYSQATFPRDGRSFDELLLAARKRADKRRDSLWERGGYSGRIFWEIIGELTSRNFEGFESATFDAGSGQDLSEFFIDQINELMVKEIARCPQRRGIMYYGTKSISAGLPVIKNLGYAGHAATKVFLVGEGEGSVWEIRNAMPLLLDDPRLRETFFTFFLNEDTAYGLVCKENWGATFSCFHTADPVLVEGLISKFQNEYSLQEQLG